MQSTDAYEITLPYPPSVNTYWRAVKGRMLISRDGREYKQAVGVHVLTNGRRKVMTGRLAMTIEIYPPDNRRRDIDNTAKAVLDALGTANVYEDDFQICDLRLVRRKVSKPGRVEVRITEVTDGIDHS